MEDWVSCYAVSLNEDYKKGETMGLLTILKKMKQKEKEMRILMLYPS